MNALFAYGSKRLAQRVEDMVGADHIDQPVAREIGLQGRLRPALHNNPAFWWASECRIAISAPKVGAIPSSNIAKMTCRILWQMNLQNRTSLICAVFILERTKSPNTRLTALKVDSTLLRL